MLRWAHTHRTSRSCAFQPLQSLFNTERSHMRMRTHPRIPQLRADYRSYLESRLIKLNKRTVHRSMHWVWKPSEHRKVRIVFYIVTPNHLSQASNNLFLSGPYRVNPFSILCSPRYSQLLIILECWLHASESGSGLLDIIDKVCELPGDESSLQS